jgi:hypothetical protein
MILDGLKNSLCLELIHNIYRKTIRQGQDEYGQAPNMMEGQTAEKLVIGLKLKEIIPITAAGFKITIGQLHCFGNSRSSGSKNDCSNII